jgi:8-oxo-dGTP pyrophosphatase MutT (NUDIX family)
LSEKPVQPVDAATVILVRHGVPLGTPWQCFMVRRHVRSEFAADVYVFPGGKVDAEDRRPDLMQFVLNHDEPHDRAESEVTWLALKLAGIRELFEEAGVLLANGPDGAPLRFEGANAGTFAEYRRKLQSGEMSMLDLARAEGLRYPADRLHPFSRWITPVISPRRYDTRFFVAYLPRGQEPLHDALETTDSAWIAPKNALRRYREGNFPLVFATEKHLERMSRFRSIEEMIASTEMADLQPVVPKAIKRGDQMVFLLPGDEGY